LQIVTWRFETPFLQDAEVSPLQMARTKTSRRTWSSAISAAALAAAMQKNVARAVRISEGRVKALRKFGRAITALGHQAITHGASPGASLHQLRQQNNSAIVLEETHLQTIRHVPAALIRTFAVADHAELRHALRAAQQGESHRIRDAAARATELSIFARNRRALERRARAAALVPAAIAAQNAPAARTLLQITAALEDEVIEDGELLL
jgi:hypothetical protein